MTSSQSPSTPTRPAVFWAVVIVAFLCIFFSISLILAAGDYLIFGSFGHDSFNFLTSAVMLYACFAVAEKVAEKYARGRRVSFFEWWNPQLTDQKARKKAIWLAACISGVNAVVAAFSLLVPSSQGIAIFLFMIGYVASSFFTWKVSRIASIVGLSLYSVATLIAAIGLIMSKLNLASVQDNQINAPAWLTSILFLTLLVNGVRAVFAEHTLQSKRETALELSPTTAQEAAARPARLS